MTRAVAGAAIPAAAARWLAAQWDFEAWTPEWTTGAADAVIARTSLHHTTDRRGCRTGIHDAGTAKG